MVSCGKTFKTSNGAEVPGESTTVDLLRVCYSSLFWSVYSDLICLQYQQSSNPTASESSVFLMRCGDASTHLPSLVALYCV